MKLFMAILVMLLAVLLLSSCFLPRLNDGSTIALPFMSNTEGNTCSNISEGGLVALQGDKLYYYFSDDNWLFNKEGLYVSKLDGSGARRIVKGDISDINVIGDWVYYIKSTKNKDVKAGNVFRYDAYKARIDGTDETRLAENCSRLYVNGNELYYTTERDYMGYHDANIADNVDFSMHLCKLDLSSGKISVLVQQDVYDYSVSGNAIYFLGEHGIYKVNSEGQAQQQIVQGGFQDGPQSIFIDGNMLYYQQHDSMVQVPLTGISNSIIIHRDATDMMPYHGSLLYTTSWSQLFQTTPDGAKETQLKYDEISRVYVFGDKVFGWTYEKEPQEITGMFGD